MEPVSGPDADRLPEPGTTEKPGPAAIALLVGGIVLAIVWLGLSVAAAGNETELFGAEHALVAPLALLGLFTAIATGFSSVLQLAPGFRPLGRRMLLASVISLPVWFGVTYTVAHI